MHSLLASLVVVQLIALMMPGPDFFFVTRTAVSQSRGKAILGVLGITVGCGVWAGLSMVGLHILFETAGWLRGIVTGLGGAYLLWMGANLLLSVWKSRRAAAHLTAAAETAEPELQTEGDMRHPFLFGLFTNLSNAKAIIYFGSVFTTFAAADLGLAGKLAVLGIVLLETFLWFGFVALVFGLPQMRRGYQRMSRVIDAAAGVIFAWFGAALLVEAVRLGI